MIDCCYYLFYSYSVKPERERPIKSKREREREGGKEQRGARRAGKHMVGLRALSEYNATARCNVDVIASGLASLPNNDDAKNNKLQPAR